MDHDVAVTIDIDIVREFGYAIKLPYEVSMAPIYVYEYTDYTLVSTTSEMACEELVDDYTVNIVYVSGMPWYIGHEEETIILIFDEHNILLKEYSSVGESAIIRIEIYKQ